MNYVLAGGTVTIIQERTISVGHICRINASMGLCGITTGDIKVVQIKLPEDMDADERMNSVDSWDNLEPSDEYYDEYMDMICNRPWVQYEYQHTKVLEGEEVQWLPLEEFLSHKSQY